MEVDGCVDSGACVGECGSLLRAAAYRAGRAWMRRACRSWTKPGSTSEPHSGAPSGAAMNCAFPVKCRPFRSQTTGWHA